MNHQKFPLQVFSPAPFFEFNENVGLKKLTVEDCQRL
jgi:hypothetical protein